MAIALDISHFTESTSGPLTTQQLDDAWDAGVRTFRPSIANQAVAVRQIDAIVDNGHPFNICTYRYYYFGSMLTEAVIDKAFIQRVRDLKYNIQLHSLDIEDTNPNVTTTQRILETNQLVEAFGGFCLTDLYTAYWYWTQYMSNTQSFNFMPLWFADWDNIPDLNIDPPFGGFTKGHMKQYAGDQYFAGIWCDVNYYEEDIVTPPPPINELNILRVNPNKLYKFELE